MYVLQAIPPQVSRLRRTHPMMKMHQSQAMMSFLLQLLPFAWGTNLVLKGFAAESPARTSPYALQQTKLLFGMIMRPLCTVDCGY